MIELMALGFLIGMGHAIEADHLAAVSAIAVKEQRRGRIIRHGLSWGVGHATMLFIIAGGVIWFGTALDERLAPGLEAIVGMMLIILGGRILWRLGRDRIHIHRHAHADGTQHLHAHSHRHDQSPHEAASHHHGHPVGLSLGSLAIGLVHGLAGSAALIVLAASALTEPAFGLLYIALFGIGSILGMGLLSVVIAFPMAWSAGGLTMAHHLFQILVALGSVTIGGMTLNESLHTLSRLI